MTQFQTDLSAAAGPYGQFGRVTGRSKTEKSFRLSNDENGNVACKVI